MDSGSGKDRRDQRKGGEPGSPIPTAEQSYRAVLPQQFEEDGVSPSGKRVLSGRACSSGNYTRTGSRKGLLSGLQMSEIVFHYEGDTDDAARLLPNIPSPLEGVDGPSHPKRMSRGLTPLWSLAEHPPTHPVILQTTFFLCNSYNSPSS